MRGDIIRTTYAPVSDAPTGINWRHNATCREEDPDLFFPVGNTGPALLQIKEAKTVCARCPVIEHCLQWAMESAQAHGIWGGLDEDERRAMKRRAARRRARNASTPQEM